MSRDQDQYASINAHSIDSKGTDLDRPNKSYIENQNLIQTRSIRNPELSPCFYQNMKALENIKPIREYRDQAMKQEEQLSEKQVAKQKILKLLGKKRRNKKGKGEQNCEQQRESLDDSINGKQNYNNFF